MHIVISRALAGAAHSMCFVSAINIHAKYLPARLHDLSFSYTQSSQYLGTAIGIALGGLLPATCGWRWVFYTAAILGAAVLVLSIWAISRRVETKHISWARFAQNIDLGGGLLGILVMLFIFYALACVPQVLNETTKINILIQSQQCHHEQCGYTEQVMALRSSGPWMGSSGSLFVLARLLGKRLYARRTGLPLDQQPLHFNLFSGILHLCFIAFDVTIHGSCFPTGAGPLAPPILMANATHSSHGYTQHSLRGEIIASYSDKYNLDCNYSDFQSCPAVDGDSTR